MKLFEPFVYPMCSVLGKPIADQIRIPDYQREYVWKHENIERLFLDLFHGHEWMGSRPDYFVGPMVFVVPKKTEALVIDGQQRLTTISLACRAIALKLDEQIEPEHGLALSRKDPKTKKRVPRLALLPPHNKFFEAVMIGTESERAAALKSRSKLATAFRQISTEIDEVIADQESNGVSPDETLRAMLLRLMEDCKVLVVTTEQQSYGYVIYETLNSRRKPLTASELTKNKIFSILSDQNHRVEKQAKKKWSTIGTRLGSRGHERVDELLAAHWYSHHEYVAKHRLYDDVCKQLEGERGGKKPLERRKEAATLLDSLLIDAEHFRLIVDPYCQAAKELSDERRNMLLRLNYADCRIARPLMLAVMRSAPSAVDEVLAQIETITYRASLGGIGSQRLFDAYKDIAREVGAKKLTNAKAITEAIAKHLSKNNIHLGSIDVNDKLIAGTFSNTGKSIRPLLMKYESKTAGKEFEWVKKRKVHVEHILPQTWCEEVGKECGLVPNNGYEAVVAKFGNLTLFDGKLNIELRNHPFSIKQKRYNDSLVRHTQKLTSYTAFTLAEVQTRTESMAKVLSAALAWKWE